MSRQKQWYVCQYGFDRIRTFTATKRGIINRLKKTNYVIWADSLHIINYYSDDVVLTPENSLDDFFTQEEIKELRNESN